MSRIQIFMASMVWSFGKRWLCGYYCQPIWSRYQSMLILIHSVLNLISQLYFVRFSSFALNSMQTGNSKTFSHQLLVLCTTVNFSWKIPDLSPFWKRKRLECPKHSFRSHVFYLWQKLNVTWVSGLQIQSNVCLKCIWIHAFSNIVSYEISFVNSLE